MFNHKQIAVLVFTLISVAALSGCGTLRTQSMSDRGRQIAFHEMNHCRYSNEFHRVPQMYSGTKSDILFLMGKEGCLWPTGEELLVNIPLIIAYYPMTLIDLPLSLVCDTVLLPYTAYKQIRYGDLVDPPYIRMAERYERDKDYENAIKTYQRFLEVLPKYNTHDHYSYGDWNIYSHIGWLYQENGNYQEAISYYEQALDFTVKDDRKWVVEKAVYINRGLADLYLKTGDYEKAIERCSQALSQVNTVRSDMFKKQLESLMNKIAEKKYSGLNRDLLLAWNRNGPYPVLLLVVNNFTRDKTYEIENAYFEHKGESYRFGGENISYPIVLQPGEEIALEIPVCDFLPLAVDCDPEKKKNARRMDQAAGMTFSDIQGLTIMAWPDATTTSRIRTVRIGDTSGRIVLHDGTVLATLDKRHRTR